MQVRNYINVSCLPPDEAWHLFQSQVGQNLSSNSRIKALAEELVKELKGLPLALIAVGVAMHPKTEAEGWQHAVNHMKQSCCHIDCLSMEEEVFRKLRFSYDSLDGTLKRCFLTCSLWPKGRYISMDELVQCWMGLGILDDKCDIYSSYMTAHSLKGDLEAVCLLERGYGYSLFGIYNYNSVKMHDVVHDMALWIASESKDKWIVRAGVGPNSSRSTVPWSKTEYVSLMDNRMKELPPCGPNSGSKELKALYLQKNMMDQSIVGAIRSFMALTYLDLSFNNLQNIPQELCALANLEYLNLSYNLEINEVPECLGDLTKLKFLYLKETRISVIPKRVISRLEALQVVDLRTWTRGTFDPPIFRELCTITNLKAAGICVENCYEYELLNQAANIPIRFLTIQKLQESAFDLSVGTCSYDNVRMTLYELEIRECKLEQIKGGDLGNPFEALTRLCVYGCVWLQHISWAMYLPCLEYLRLDSCFRMKQAFPSTENHGVEMHKKSSKTSISTFPCLKHLSFFLNTKLASLCDSNVTFPNLETLEVFRCRKLKRLPFTMQSLPQKLRALRMNQFTWNALEWEEEGVESFLQRQLQFYR